MTRYLLDTNTVSDLVRNPQGRVTARVQQLGESLVCTSVIVAAELRYGAAKKQSPRLTAQLEAVLSAMEVLPLQSPADAVYGRVRAALESTGRVIGANDLLIGSHALALDYTLVTDNEAEFARIPELRWQNWLR